MLEKMSLLSVGPWAWMCCFLNGHNGFSRCPLKALLWAVCCVPGPVRGVGPTAETQTKCPHGAYIQPGAVSCRQMHFQVHYGYGSLCPVEQNKTEVGTGRTRDGEGGRLCYRKSNRKGLEAREVSAWPQNPQGAVGLERSDREGPRRIWVHRG